MAGAALQRLRRLIPGTSGHTTCASPVGKRQGTGSPDAELIGYQREHAEKGSADSRGEGGWAPGISSRRSSRALTRRATSPRRPGARSRAPAPSRCLAISSGRRSRPLAIPPLRRGVCPQANAGARGAAASTHAQLRFSVASGQLGNGSGVLRGVRLALMSSLCPRSDFGRSNGQETCRQGKYRLWNSNP